MPEIRYKLDYDWKDADSTEAEALVHIIGENDPTKAEVLLLNYNEELTDDFGNRAVCFVPEMVNGDRVGDLTPVVNGRDARWPHRVCWAVAACLLHLRAHPEIRIFRMTGEME